MNARGLVFGTIMAVAAGFAALPQAVRAADLNVYMPQGVVGAVEKVLVPIMRDKFNTKVVITPVLSGQALTKAVAQRANPEISVFMLDEGPWLQGKQANLWDKLEGLPNMAQIPARFRDADGMGSGFLLYLLGLLYDEKAFADAKLPAPTSYEDLWNPALKGKVTIPDANSTFSYALLFKINELQGGKAAQSVDAGFAKLAQLAPNVGTFHGGASTLIPLFSQRQAWIGFNASFPAQRLAADGVPIRWVAPKEGAIAVAAYIAVAKNAPNAEAARQFVNLVLSPEYQAAQTETAFGGYVNPNTKLSPDFVSKFLLKPEDIEKASVMSWDVYLAKRTELSGRWQREIEKK
ncbi:MAG: extracellular solute-binding protein [Ferrovibrio sp.]|jgi:putative spermidine/putrescine transport system substrate-binding protein|nr:extracellular solute-binding protein [Ferrovibrio sp.]